MLPDGCYPEHDPSKSYCSENKGKDLPYPRFPSIDDLVSIEDMAQLLGVTRRHLADARFDDPPLPYFRFGRRLLISKVQIAWWMNEKQTTQIDKYFIERRRRLSKNQLFKKKGGANAAAVAKKRVG